MSTPRRPPRVPKVAPSPEALMAALAHQLQLGAAELAKIIQARGKGALVIRVSRFQVSTCMEDVRRRCLSVGPDGKTPAWTDTR